MTYLIKYLPGDLVVVPDLTSPGEHTLGIVADILIYHFKKEPEYIVFTNKYYCFNTYTDRVAYRFKGDEINFVVHLVDRLIETPFSSICRDNLCTLKDIYGGCPEGCLFDELTPDNDVYLPLDIVREIFTGIKYRVIGIGFAISTADLPDNVYQYNSYRAVAPWATEYSDILMNDLDAYLHGRTRNSRYLAEDIDVERIWEYLKQDKSRYKLIYNLCNPKVDYLTSSAIETWLPQNRLRLWKRSDNVYKFFRAGTMPELCKRCVYDGTVKCYSCRTKRLYECKDNL